MTTGYQMHTLGVRSMYALPLSIALTLGSACSSSSAAPDVTGTPQTQAPVTPSDSIASSSHSTSDNSPNGPAGRWRLRFSDEFNGSSVDTSQWHTAYWWGGTKGEEQEEYVPEGVTLSNGALHLTARPRPGNAHPYTSGMLASWGHFNVTRGSVVETRIKAPAGVGLWPAVWLHPSSGGWPPEIDIWEVRGFDPTTWLLSDHWSEAGEHRSEGFRPSNARYAAGWHTVTMQWDSTQVAWYIDGERKGLITNPIEIPNEPMYLILNLAIGGGGWPGMPDSTTVFPATFDVDYVRVWTPAP